MSNNQESNQFFPDNKLDQDDTIVEVPSNLPSPDRERIPSGYDPMQEIHLRGRAFRGLAGGGMPWWVPIAGWVIFGIPVLFLLISVLLSGNFSALPVLLIPAIFIIILWRGTNSKLSIGKRNRRRR